MFRINNGIITVNRGDSFDLPVILQTGDSVCPSYYALEEGDTLYLGLMEPNQPFETAIVRKKLEYQDLENPSEIYFRFNHKDTVCLLPGKYYYQIKLAFNDKQSNDLIVETVVDKTLFYIQE